ncbi:DUF1090 domain-containing protein [Pseudomonas sp. F1_0610]|uniref:DUF1090 domain-containing protein n=1 Tax=Pseudomonas sp. F1_0610 TaxID=3114284 RepID=UPI0039C101D7
MFKYSFYFLSLICVLPSFSYADEVICEQKIKRIEQQIEMAKAKGNAFKEQGLLKALENVKKYCTDHQLIKEQQEKVNQQQEKVKQRKAELIDAEANGKRDKIAKRERKLKEAQAELEKELKLLKDFESLKD